MTSPWIALLAATSFALALAVAWLLIERRRLRMKGEDAGRLAELANDAVIVGDLVRGGVLYANTAAEAMLGYSVAELSTRRIAELHPKALIAKSAERIAEVWEKKGLVYSDLPFVSASGEEIDVEISANLGSYQGKPAVLLHARDIRRRLAAERQIREYAADLEKTNAELRGTQNQLVQSEKMAALGTLAAGLCHEINNPIGSIVANVDVSRRALEKVTNELSVEDAAKLGKLARPLQILENLNSTNADAARRIANIVVSLRNFARLDEEQQKRVDIHEGIESALTLMRHKLEGRIDVERRYGELPEIDCRPGQLNQAIMNVLLNASEAIDAEGTITITTERADGRALIHIADSGRGIAPERISGIFDPGYTTRGVGVGTGLGLPISYRIMQEHGGSIDVNSKPGEGTTVTLVLPIR